MSQFFASGGQRIGVSIQDWFPLGLTGLISLQSKGVSRVFYNTTAQKHRFFSIQPSAFFMVQFSHPYMTSGKIIALTRQTFVSKVMSVIFNMLPKLVIAFLLEQMSFNFMAAVTICSDFGAQENSLSLFPLFPHLLP